MLLIEHLIKPRLEEIETEKLRPVPRHDFAMPTPDIPESLKGFRPLEDDPRILKQVGGAHPMFWDISVDEVSGAIEAGEPKTYFLRNVVFFLLIGLFAAAFFGTLFHLFSDRSENSLPVMLLLPLPILAIIVGGPALGSLFARMERNLWGAVRFRYYPGTGELEFPHREDHYGPDDYSGLFLGCVSGYDMTGVEKPSENVPQAVQYFLLVLDCRDAGNNDESGTWRRYDFALDDERWKPERGTKRFEKCVALFREHRNVGVIVEQETREQCFHRQRDRSRSEKNILWK